MSGGNWHHGELAIDQALMMRPFQAQPSIKRRCQNFIYAGQALIPGKSYGASGKNAVEALLKQGDLA